MVGGSRWDHRYRRYCGLPVGQVLLLIKVAGLSGGFLLSS
jgi:hypothetical protein